MQIQFMVNAKMTNFFFLSLELDEDYLGSRHQFIFDGSSKNATVMSSIYYFPLTNERVEEVGRIRMGEHTDYGSLTLLFNDDQSGLEVPFFFSFLLRTC